MGTSSSRSDNASLSLPEPRKMQVYSVVIEQQYLAQDMVRCLSSF